MQTHSPADPTLPPALRAAAWAALKAARGQTVLMDVLCPPPAPPPLVLTFPPAHRPPRLRADDAQGRARAIDRLRAWAATGPFGGNAA